MASSLRHMASNLVTRSFRPTVVSAPCFLSIYRSYTTVPKDGGFLLLFLSVTLSVDP
ncbi:hypothetical protein Hanom_Chr08g00708321 [Helianthus anomalus]